MHRPVLDLRLIQSFIALADEQSFTRAAERIGVAQSALSMRIKRLEDLLRFALMSRTSRRVGLTSQGLAFLPYARALMAAETDALAAARDIVSTPPNSLRLGSYQFLAKARSRLITRYLAAEPETEILVVYGARDELLRQLRHGAIDAIIGLSRSGLSEDGIAIKPVGKLYPHIVLPPHDMLSESSTASLAELAGRPIILMPSWPESRVQGYLTDLMKQHHLKPAAGPEPEKEAIMDYARARGAAHLAWFAHRRARHVDRGWAVIPISDADMEVELAVFVNQEITSRGARFLAALQPAITK